MSEKAILSCWEKNIVPWVKAIANDDIDTRRLVTNRAIVDAVLSTGGASLLDIGCGEGWLVREMIRRGLTATGIDAIAGFVEVAGRLGSGQFLQLQYEQLSAGRLPKRYDVAVCNFSLIGQSSVERVFKVMKSLLTVHGRFIVQTLHPRIACGEQAYRDGWRDGSWDGFDKTFVDPAPWYFRTMESWIKLFTANGLQPVKLTEPINPNTGRPASLLMVASVSR